MGLMFVELGCYLLRAILCLKVFPFLKGAPDQAKSLVLCTHDTLGEEERGTVEDGQYAPAGGFEPVW